MKKLLALTGSLYLLVACAGGELAGERQGEVVGRSDSGKGERYQSSVDDVPGQRAGDQDKPSSAVVAPLTNVDEAQLKSDASKEAYARCGVPVDADVEFISKRSSQAEQELSRSRYVLVVGDEREVILKASKDIERLCIVVVGRAAVMKLSVENAAIKNLTMHSASGRDQFDITIGSGSVVETMELSSKGSVSFFKIAGDGSYACPSLLATNGSILDCER